MAPFFLILIIWFPLALSLPTPPYSLSPLGWFYVPTPNTTTPNLPAPLNARSLLSSGHITLNDYPSLAAIALNPPYCGFAYNYPLLDLTRVTAMETATSTDCGTCLRVCGAAGCQDVLTIDKGGRGLDLSTGARDTVLGAGQDIGWAEWGVVDGGFCEGVVKGGKVDGREEEVQTHAAESVTGVVETVLAMYSTSAPPSTSIVAPEVTEAPSSSAVSSETSLVDQSTSKALASPVAEPTDEAAFLSALADPSATPTPAVIAVPSATDEEGFLSALVAETQSTASSTSSSPMTIVAEPTSYAMPGTSSTSSPPPKLANTSSSPSIPPASSSLSPAGSSSPPTSSAPSSAAAFFTAPTNSSSAAPASVPSPSSASAISPPSAYKPSSNSSAYGGVLHPIVTSGAARQVPALQRRDLGSLAVLLLALLTMVWGSMEEMEVSDGVVFVGLCGWCFSLGVLGRVRKGGGRT
ncbi:hypothetical protein MMC18_005882 [Xylographa bjoerkii]|nr:hypothetical protein [Xylographa bjoerkii]